MQEATYLGWSSGPTVQGWSAFSSVFQHDEKGRENKHIFLMVSSALLLLRSNNGRPHGLLDSGDGRGDAARRKDAGARDNCY